MLIYPQNVVSIDSITVDAATLEKDVTFIGKVTVPNPPLVNQEFATKGYMDSRISNVGSDKVKVDGSVVMTGRLTLGGVASGGGHLVKKSYVDSAIVIGLGGNSTVSSSVETSLAGSALTVKSGDIIRKPTSVTPSGYLKCNGGVVSKSSYGALYAVVGSQYNKTQMTNGNGQPWRLQAGFNTSQSGDITGWTTGTALPVSMYDSSVIVTNSRVYLLGGGNNTSTVYTCPINSDGTLGTWTTSTALPITFCQGQVITTTNKCYILGGRINSTIGSGVYTCPINLDGTLGTWTTGTSLPINITYGQSFVTFNRIYLLGGFNQTSAFLNTVYTSVINSDGSLGTWTAGTNLPATITDSTAVVTSNRVYLLGGTISSIASSTVYVATINADGTLGSWTTGTSLPGTVILSVSVISANYVYLMGGRINGTDSSIVYKAPVNQDGTIGAWTTGTALPGTSRFSQTVITSSRIYILGTNYNSTVYTANILGGRNDYMSLPLIGADSTTQFTLPDLTTQDATTTGLYSYIKT